MPHLVICRAPVEAPQADGRAGIGQGRGEDLIRQQGIQIPVRGLLRIPTDADGDAPPAILIPAGGHGSRGQVVERRANRYNPGAG